MITLPLTSILIPVFNNLKMLIHMIDSLTQHTPPYPYEVILVDNHSTEEGAATYLEQLAHLPQVTLLRNHCNLGFGKANNQALAVSRGEILVLLNSDMFVTRSWLGALLRCFQQHPNCGAVQCKILMPDHQTHPSLWKTQTIGARFDPQGLPQYFLDGLPRRDPQVNRPRPLPAFMGTGVGLRRQIVEEIGFFDENYDLVFLEDTDLSLRLSEQGYEIWYEPGSEICHFHNSSMPHLSQETFDRSRLNNMALFKKKWPIQRMATILAKHGFTME